VKIQHHIKLSIGVTQIQEKVILCNAFS